MDKCSHCAMALDYSFWWLSTASSHRIIALWVHAFRQWNERLTSQLVYVPVVTGDSLRHVEAYKPFLFLC